LERLNWDEISQASWSLLAIGFKGDFHKWADTFILCHEAKFDFEQGNNFSHDHLQQLQQQLRGAVVQPTDYRFQKFQ
jgi:hypothetical protein